MNPEEPRTTTMWKETWEIVLSVWLKRSSKHLWWHTCIKLMRAVCTFFAKILDPQVFFFGYTQTKKQTNTTEWTTLCAYCAQDNNTCTMYVQNVPPVASQGAPALSFQDYILYWVSRSVLSPTLVHIRSRNVTWAPVDTPSATPYLGGHHWMGVIWPEEGERNKRRYTCTHEYMNDIMCKTCMHINTLFGSWISKAESSCDLHVWKVILGSS